MAIDKFKSLSAGLPVSTRSSPKRELAPITTTLAFCLTNNLDSSTSIGMSVNGHFSTPTLDFVPNSANFLIYLLRSLSRHWRPLTAVRSCHRKSDSPAQVFTSNYTMVSLSLDYRRSFRVFDMFIESVVARIASCWKSIVFQVFPPQRRCNFIQLQPVANRKTDRLKIRRIINTHEF